MKIWITALADLTADKGSTRHLRELFAGLLRRGHDVTMWVSRERPMTPEPGIEPIAMPRIPVRGLRFLSGLLFFQAILVVRLLARFRRERPDVLYARNDVFLLAPWLVSVATGVQLVSELNGVFPFELHLRGHGRAAIATSRWIERRVYRRSRKVVCVAETMRRYVVDELGIPEEKTRVSANGADLERFAPGDGSRVRAAIGATDGDVVIGYVGGLQPYQGVIRMVECARPLIADGLPVRVLVVGGGADQPALSALAEEPDLAGRLTVTGSVPYDDVPDYVRAMDICTLPKLGRVPGSRHEYSASPLKAFEYMACGQPIVSNDVTDFRFLADCGAALVADVDRPGAFTDALRKMATDAELRRTVGEAGLRFAREHGSWDASIGRIAALLSEEFDS